MLIHQEEKGKRAVINTKNDEDQSFSFCLAYGDIEYEIKKQWTTKIITRVIKKYALKRDLGIEGPVPADSKI